MPIPVQRLSAKILVFVAAMVLLIALARSAWAQTDIPKGVGFTHIPSGQGHGSAVCNKAGWINPWISNPKLHDLALNDPQFTNSGTSFVRWLRGGRQAIIISVGWRGPSLCPATDPCCTIPIPSTNVDNFVIDLTTGKIASSPTVLFRKLQGQDQAYFYNEGLHPLYAGATNKLTGFILVTHHDLTKSSSAEIWQIKPDGTPVKKLIPQDVGAHGCQTSPDAQYLVCERLGPEFNQKGFLLTKIDGTPVSDVKWSNTIIPIGFGSWSSDSAGFVFYACHPTTACTDGGYLVYYDIIRKSFTPLAPDYTPAFFCLYTKTCRDSGASGSEIPARSPLPGWFYYSVLIGSTSGAKPRGVLGSVSRDNPNVFHPLTFAESSEPGHPQVSANNNLVVYTANVSESDTSAALYSVDVHSLAVRKLGLLLPKDNIYAPQWQDWPSRSITGSGVTSSQNAAVKP